MNLRLPCRRFLKGRDKRMTAASDKWPSQFKMAKVFDSPIGKELTFFFVTGIVNEKQLEYVAGRINVLTVQEIEPDKLVVSALLNQEQFEEFNKVFERFSRDHRGQYQSVAKAIVAAHAELTEGH